MTWKNILVRWPHLLEHLCRDFAHLEVTALRRLRGDREKMEDYLAETHDLTIAEAREVLDDWLIYRAKRMTLSSAA